MWVLLMDKVPMDELQKLVMSPYFGIGKLKFRVKNMGHTPEKADPSHSGETIEAGVNMAPTKVNVKIEQGGSLELAPPAGPR